MICGSLWQSWQAMPSLSHGTIILQHFCIMLLHAYLRVSYAEGLTSPQTSRHWLWRQSGKPYNMPVTLNVQESEVKSAQLAQQDAELAAAKQELATRLAAHQDFERVRLATYVPILPCKTLSLFQQVMTSKLFKIMLYMSSDFR